MTEADVQTRSVTVERTLPHSPEKIWRALTQGHCKVLAVEPNRTLSYSWAAYGLESIVTWTLTAAGTGTHLRMEQSGFRLDQQQAFEGAKQGWARFLGALEQVLSRAE
jgi:uncharacterized protein YndB with AHSA1/START domain